MSFYDFLQNVFSTVEILIHSKIFFVSFSAFFFCSFFRICFKTLGMKIKFNFDFSYFVNKFRLYKKRFEFKLDDF